MRPVRIAVFNDEIATEDGMKILSLVETPAIGFEAVQMSEYKEIKLEIEDEGERIIFTPVLIPDQKIYRRDGEDEFDLVFPKETIKQIAVNFARMNVNNKVDINHSTKLIDGVVFFEMFLKDSRRAKSLGNFDELPDGTLFATGKVYNDEVWQKIQAGEIKGVSIDGLFKTKPAEMQLSEDEVNFIMDLANNFIQKNQ